MIVLSSVRFMEGSNIHVIPDLIDVRHDHVGFSEEHETLCFSFPHIHVWKLPMCIRTYIYCPLLGGCYVYCSK